MSILTGLFPPTSGEVWVYGKSVRTQVDDVHKSLGVCPQYNVLFEWLTVEEHLLFIGYVRGVPLEQLRLDITQLLRDLN
jgi:ABC-type multidrug transport system ATPase subunit